MEWTIAFGTSSAPEAIEQPHGGGQRDRQDDLRENAVRPPAPNSIQGVFVAKTSTSTSGMFAEIINVAAPKRVRRLRPAAPRA